MRAEYLIERKVIDFIAENDLIEQDSNIIVGFSGGADSTGLLLLLHALSGRLHLELRALHINHCIRGEAADGDEQFCCELCERLGIPFKAVRLDIPTLARDMKCGEEEAGRILRYRTFADEKKLLTAETGRTTYIAVAHHRDDQAETVLAHILRGAGLNGLGGMRPRREDGVIRPVLCLTHEELCSYCRLKEVVWCVDASNSDNRYRRNSIRNELLPYLRENYNPGVDDALIALSGEAAEISDMLASEADEFLKQSCKHSENSSCIDRAAFESLHPVKQRRVLYSALRSLWQSDKNGPQRIHIESILKALSTGSGCELPGGLVFRTERDGLYISISQTLAEKNTGVVRVVVPGMVVCGDYRLTFSRAETAVPEKNRMKAFLNADLLTEQLTVRFRRDGDSFSPFGMQGKRKLLADYLSDRHIPHSERDRIPLVCCGDNIVYAAGLTVDGRFAFAEGSACIIIECEHI